jgi:serine O-acetyltransferase
MIIDNLALGKELKYLFQKFYVLELVDINFEDYEVYDEALAVFQFDYNRYFPKATIVKENLFSRIELIGILLYRVSRNYFLKGNEKAALHYSNLGRIISGFDIFFSADIGKGIKINHGLGTVIGARCKIGENALVHQNVTFGDRNGGRPVLLDNVTVYSGAKVLGNITCGNNSVIAANCVCMIDVPDNGLIAGIPGKIKKK